MLERRGATQEGELLHCWIMEGSRLLHLVGEFLHQLEGAALLDTGVNAAALVGTAM